MALVDLAIAGDHGTATLAQLRAFIWRRHAARVAAKREAGIAVKELPQAEIAGIATAYHAIGRELGMDAGGAVAQMMHETDSLTFGNQVAPEQHNPAGIGATNDGAAGLTLPDWAAGVRIHYIHLRAWANLPGGDASPRYRHVLAAAASKGFAVTWRDLGGRWAVPGLTYGDGLDRYWRELVNEPGAAMKPKLAIAAGHHNTSGGNEYEHETTGLLLPLTIAECERLGIEVRTYTPDGPDADALPGDGDFPGALDTAAATLVRWASEGWRADLYLEQHTEGVGNPAVRGVFGIYPDQPTLGDVDTDARDRLIPLVVDRVCALTGMPKRGNGLMSERSTGAGSLGVFRATRPLKGTLTRFLVEYGAHTNPIERAMHRDPNWLRAAARGTAEGIALYFGLPIVAPEPPTPPDDPQAAIPVGPYLNRDGSRVLLGGLFRRWWEANPDRLVHWGWPITNERAEVLQDGREYVVQYFERERFQLDAPDRVGYGLIGLELAMIRGLR